jgi:hypothetical protein
MGNFGPKLLNIKYFVIWTKFDPPRNTLLLKMAIFDEKHVKKSENGNKPAKIRWELLFCNNFTEK